MLLWLTGGGLADGGVLGAQLEAVHAEAVEAAMGVDAALRARVGGGALVDVHAGLAVVLETEARVAPALWDTPGTMGKNKVRLCGAK